MALQALTSPRMDGLSVLEVGLAVGMLVAACVSILFSVLRVSREKTQQAVVLQQEIVKDAAFLLPASALTGYLWLWGGADHWVTTFNQFVLLLVLFEVVYWVPFFGFRILNELFRK